MKKITVELTDREAITLAGVLIFLICNKCNEECAGCPLSDVHRKLMCAIDEACGDEADE